MKFWSQVSQTQTLVLKLDENLWLHPFLNRLGTAKNKTKEKKQKTMQPVTLKSMKLLIQSFELET